MIMVNNHVAIKRW